MNLRHLLNILMMFSRYKIVLEYVLNSCTAAKPIFFCRSVLRENRCLEVLLGQLKSPSLTIVSNACGTLWNFSARDPVDQEQLWSLGAVPMLKSLTNSKHKTISTCSLAALKNLYAASSTASQVRKKPLRYFHTD